MSDDEPIDIRKQKREQFESKLCGDGGSAVKEASADPAEFIHIDGADELDDAVASYDVVFMNLYADRRGSCRVFEPTVKKLAENTDAAAAKVDVNTNQESAAQYQVRGVLTMVLSADNEVVEQFAGICGYDDLKNLVEAHLA